MGLIDDFKIGSGELFSVARRVISRDGSAANTLKRAQHGCSYREAIPASAKSTDLTGRVRIVLPQSTPDDKAHVYFEYGLLTDLFVVTHNDKSNSHIRKYPLSRIDLVPDIRPEGD